MAKDPRNRDQPIEDTKKRLAQGGTEGNLGLDGKAGVYGEREDWQQGTGTHVSQAQHLGN